MSCELEAQALTYNYVRGARRTGRGLRNFTAGFGPGLTLVTGSNGAGKSTLLRLLATTLAPNNGELRWCSQPVARHPRLYRAILGYLPQSFNVYERWRATEFLSYVARLKHVPEPQIGLSVQRVLAAVHLAERADDPVAHFSHGALRRLGLAQALLNRPRVLILDEPFAGLAPEERVNALGQIVLQARTNLVILATHILDDLESYAARVLILREGRCIADTTPAGLLDDAGLVPAGGALEQAYNDFMDTTLERESSR